MQNGHDQKSSLNDVQKLYEEILRNLEEIPAISSNVAGGKMKHQKINGRIAEITLGQRRRWLLAAACAAKP